MSSSISGSSGSIAFGSILISLISPAPFAMTVTMPPPAVAWTVSFASSSCAFCICSCIWPTCCSNLSMSMPIASVLPFVGVQGLFHELEDLFLAGRLVELELVLPRLALGEREPEVASGHLVERVGEQRGVLRLLGQLSVERGARGELDGQRVARRALPGEPRARPMQPGSSVPRRPGGSCAARPPEAARARATAA